LNNVSTKYKFKISTHAKIATKRDFSLREAIVSGYSAYPKYLRYNRLLDSLMVDVLKFKPLKGID